MFSTTDLRGFLSLLTLLPFTIAQSNPPGVTSPLITQCHPSSNVVCVNKYAAVLPYHFYREAENGSNDVTYGQTTLSTDNTTFPTISAADFLVFDDRAIDLLGGTPSYEYFFNHSVAVHEAPVYVRQFNRLYFSQLAPPAGYLPQLIVDLNQDPPTLSEFISDPPVYAPNGGTFHNGLVYWGASGGNDSIGGGEQRSGIRTLDPATNKTTVLLNNYFGYYFNTIDDLFVDSKGNVWFTDPLYSWFNALTDTPPQLEAASYRFNPSTGSVTVVDDSIVQPNGIAKSPDEKYIYISDTGAVAGTYDPSPADANIHVTPYNQTGKRTIYKFDVVDNGNAISGKRPIWLAQDWIPDGLKVAANGMVVTGAGKGVDVLDEYGTLIVRVQTNYTVQNFAWVDDPTTGQLTEFWMVGNGGISRVRWNLPGQELV